MRIHAHIVSYNEEMILPFTLDYYSGFSERIFVYDNMSTDSSDEIYKRYDKVEVIKWSSNQEINENYYMDIKSNAYRHTSRDADWVMVCDADEFVYHKNLVGLLKSYSEAGVNVPFTCGHEMACESFPEYDGRLLPELVRFGSGYLSYLSKSIVFNPRIDMRFGPGTHTFEAEGVVRSPSAELKILHYKYMGAEYILRSYAAREARLSETNRRNGWGIHYGRTKEAIGFMKEIIKMKNIVVC